MYFSLVNGKDEDLRYFERMNRKRISTVIAIMAEIAAEVISGRLTSCSWPDQALPAPFCQRSQDKGKRRPKLTSCQKINIFGQAAVCRSPVAMAKMAAHL